ncbi:exopolysaccharide biosynthesis protein [Roseomonas sp. HF4]|uniref:exopolysaccharide biosynthesis protein n=1 Tax=Roseomonas sp. HF4 TaxID=2562313 RepID=UPI0010C04096|nr:exopolysaccharide biosynthesis protein [Roseomonas sp. HF4]
MHGTVDQVGVARAHAPASELILSVARSWPEPRITMGELMQAFGMRSYGLLIVLFALPNLLPIYIPGLSPIFGAPLGIVCLQLALGYPTPRLPGFLTRRSMRRSDLEMIALKAQAWLRRIERFVKPRPSFLTRRRAERAIGAYGAFLAVIVIVPLPFTNGPPSLACAIMAIGMMEEDSLTILAGIVVGLFGAALGISIIGTVWVLVVTAFQWAFGL